MKTRSSGIYPRIDVDDDITEAEVRQLWDKMEADDERERREEEQRRQQDPITEHLRRQEERLNFWFIWFPLAVTLSFAAILATERLT